jgi:hypothetical protein
MVGVEPAIDGLAADPEPPGEGGDIAPFLQEEFFQLGPSRARRELSDPGN